MGKTSLRAVVRPRRIATLLARLPIAFFLVWCNLIAAQSRPIAPEGFEVNDSHFHLTNYIQEGTDIHKFVHIMGTKVGRVALFGIPLQQQWSYRNSGDRAPTY